MLRVISGITIPETIAQDKTSALVRSCFAHESTAFSAVDSASRSDALYLLLIGAGVAALAHNDTSKVRRMRDYATTLPRYKTDKSGVPMGAIGRILSLVNEAGSIGKSRFIKDATEHSLTDLFTVPAWSAMMDRALPVKVAKSATSPADADADVPADADADVQVKVNQAAINATTLHSLIDYFGLTLTADQLSVITAKISAIDAINGTSTIGMSVDEVVTEVVTEAVTEAVTVVKAKRKAKAKQAA